MRAVYTFGIVLCCTFASAQVRVVVPKNAFKSSELIHAQVVNTTNVRISFCIEAGHFSMNGNDVEATPIPFLVQAPGRRRLNHFFRKGWSTLLLGPDVGSIRAPVDLEAGKSYDFPFRLTGEGSVRLVLYYWPGALDSVCSPSLKNARKAVSDRFHIGKGRRDSVTAGEAKIKSLRDQRSVAKTPPRKEKQKVHRGCETRSAGPLCTSLVPYLVSAEKC